MSRRKELSGKKFGKLTVKQVSEKRGPRGELYWDCECDCGNTKSIRSSYLNKGKVQCCGCTHRGNLKGRSFGHLIVLERSEKTNSHGNVYWTCECKRCGNQKDIAANGLRSGYHKSCGCLKKTRTKESSKTIPGHIWYSIQDSAKRRGIGFDLTVEEAEELLEEQKYECPLTGCYLGFDIVNPKSSNTTASLDRKDSSRPYSKDNCWWILKPINIMKGSMTVEDFTMYCKMICNRHSKGGYMPTIDQNIQSGHNPVYLVKVDDKNYNLVIGKEKPRPSRGSDGAVNCPDGVSFDKMHGVSYGSLDADLMFKLGWEHLARIEIGDEIQKLGYRLMNRIPKQIYGQRYLPTIDIRHEDKDRKVFDDLSSIAEGTILARIKIIHFDDE